MAIELCPTWSNSKFKYSSERRMLIYIAFVFFNRTKSRSVSREDSGYCPNGCKDTDKGENTQADFRNFQMLDRR